ncbi:hypothetical protein ACIQCD_15800 [Streptomyces sp. NPDC093250]|uniref:hypothetical protein n=1 Tax=Streptomyces sp. NPDC093250 TaxID=3366036 RepID=UPI0037FCCA52
MAFCTAVFGWSVDPSLRPAGAWSADFGGMVRMDEKFPHEVPAHWRPYFAVDDVDAPAVIAPEGGAGPGVPSHAQCA